MTGQGSPGSRRPIRLVVGMVLLAMGLAYVWRGSVGSAIGSLFLVCGVLLTGMTLTRQRRQSAVSGGALRPLPLDLLLVAVPVLVGAAIMVGLHLLFDRD